MRTRPSRTASMAGSASGSIFTNHWSDTSGSTMVPQRSQWGTLWVCGSFFDQVAFALKLVHHAFARLRPRVWPA